MEDFGLLVGETTIDLVCFPGDYWLSPSLMEPAGFSLEESLLAEAFSGMFEGWPSFFFRMPLFLMGASVPALEATDLVVICFLSDLFEWTVKGLV